MSEVSQITQTVDSVFIFIVGISLILLLGITITMFYFIIRFHHKRNPKATPIEGSIKLEIIWTVVPVILALVMFWVGYQGFEHMRNVPEGATQIKVTGRMWAWQFEYGNGKKTDTLYVPVGKPIEMLVTSIDVNHSFYVPAFRVKTDAIKGKINNLWFQVDKAGSYDIACAEYCGLRHAYMYSKVVAIPEAEYAVWINEDVGPREIDMSDVELVLAEGMKLYQDRNCNACHTLDGSKIIGPSFKGIYGKTEVVIENGVEKTITVDDDYLYRSIYEPNAQIVKGYQPLMPSQTGISSEQDVRILIEFIKDQK
jgi:cytochrome c oxidase subunit 2